MKHVLMTLVVGLVVGACGGVMEDDAPVAESAPLGQAEQAYRCGFCGDGYCCPEFETRSMCPSDCGPVVCGDGFCDAGESCTADCGSQPVCGDGICDAGESCTADCGFQPICGDGICSTGEGNLSCPEDCPCGLQRCR